MMSLRCGVVYRTPEYLHKHARADDPVDFVLLRSTLVDPPRAAGARSIAQVIESCHPCAEKIPYVWHKVTHAAKDRGKDWGTRSAPGEIRNEGHLQNTPEVEHAWDVSLRVIEELGATHCVLRTPATFGPGSLHRKRLAEFSKKAQNQGTTIIWEPEGLWTVEVARPFAASQGLELMFSATTVTGQVSEDLGPGWLRVNGELPGRNAEVLAYELGQKLVMEASLGGEVQSQLPACLVFGGPRAYANLRSFHRAWRLCQEDFVD